MIPRSSTPSPTTTISPLQNYATPALLMVLLNFLKSFLVQSYPKISCTYHIPETMSMPITSVSPTLKNNQQIDFSSGRNSPQPYGLYYIQRFHTGHEISQFVLLELKKTPTIIKMEQMSNSSHQHINSPNINEVLVLMDNSYVQN